MSLRSFCCHVIVLRICVLSPQTKKKKYVKEKAFPFIKISQAAPVRPYHTVIHLSHTNILNITQKISAPDPSTDRPNAET